MPTIPRSRTGTALARHGDLIRRALIALVAVAAVAALGCGEIDDPPSTVVEGTHAHLSDVGPQRFSLSPRPPSRNRRTLR